LSLINQLLKECNLETCSSIRRFGFYRTTKIVATLSDSADWKAAAAQSQRFYWVTRTSTITVSLFIRLCQRQISQTDQQRLRFSTSVTRARNACPSPGSLSTRYLRPPLFLNRFLLHTLRHPLFREHFP